MKTCRNCGALNGDLMTKCNSCGAALEEPIKLELKTETFVQPPVFPEDLEDDENKIELTLEPAASASVLEPEASEEPAPNLSESILKPEAPDGPVPNVSEPVPAQDAPESVPVTPPVYPNPPVIDPEPEIRTPYYTGPASYTNPRTETSAGGRVNLTQEAINEQKQRRQEQKQKGTGFFDAGASSGRQNHSTKQEYQIDPARAAAITGTTGLVVGLIGLVLIVVFGAIGSCTGVGAASLVLTLVGLALSIIGLVISSKDRKESGGTCARANTAFVVSLIGIIIGAILLLIGISCVGCIGCIGCAAASAIVG